MRVKMSKQPPPAPTASAVGPCPTIIQIVGRPGTGSLPSTFAPPPITIIQVRNLQRYLTMIHADVAVKHLVPCIFTTKLNDIDFQKYSTFMSRGQVLLA